jgi:diadenylate cyclase
VRRRAAIERFLCRRLFWRPARDKLAVEETEARELFSCKYLQENRSVRQGARSEGAEETMRVAWSGLTSNLGLWWRDFYRQVDAAALLDIALVATAIYYLLVLAQGTRAMSLLKGLAVLLGIMKGAQWMGMDTLQWIIGQAIFASALVVVILFQPEIRAALNQIGRGQLDALGLSWHRPASEEATRAVADITRAVETLAAKRIGALIAIERSTGLEDLAATGTRLEARLSAELLGAVFQTGNPLHDGAAIVRADTLVAAACILPLSQTESLPRTVGTRHRAALGLSEVSDALVIVVSEETGNVSLAVNGTMNSILQPRLLADELLSLLGGREQGAPRLRPFARGVAHSAFHVPKSTLRTTWGTLRSTIKR